MTTKETSPPNPPVLDHGRRMTLGVAGGVGGVMPKDVVGVKVDQPVPGDGGSASDRGGPGDAAEENAEEEEPQFETLILTVYIVVGCGVGSLVMLCVIRKVRGCNCVGSVGVGGVDDCVFVAVFFFWGVILLGFFGCLSY